MFFYSLKHGLSLLFQGSIHVEVNTNWNTRQVGAAISQNWKLLGICKKEKYLESICTFRGCFRRRTRRGSWTSRIGSRGLAASTSTRSRPRSSSRARPEWILPSRSLTSRSALASRQSKKQDATLKPKVWWH